MHTARLRVPARCGAVLAAEPAVVAPAVEAFYTRDREDMKAKASAPILLVVIQAIEGEWRRERGSRGEVRVERRGEGGGQEAPKRCRKGMMDRKRLWGEDGGGRGLEWALICAWLPQLIDGIDAVQAAARQRHFPAEDMVTVLCRFNRCLYAQLHGQAWEPPRVRTPQTTSPGLPIPTCFPCLMQIHVVAPPPISFPRSPSPPIPSPSPSPLIPYPRFPFPSPSPPVSIFFKAAVLHVEAFQPGRLLIRSFTTPACRQGYPMPPPDSPATKAAVLGSKMTAGIEMLLRRHDGNLQGAAAGREGRQAVPWKKFLGSLQRIGYFKVQRPFARCLAALLCSDSCHKHVLPDAGRMLYAEWGGAVSGQGRETWK